MAQIIFGITEGHHRMLQDLVQINDKNVKLLNFEIMISLLLQMQVYGGVSSL
jgi:hypothetical protein